MDRAVIEKVQSFGFRVYMRNRSDTWLVFVDEFDRLGMLEGDRLSGRYNLSTVHKPNTTTGTGYQVERHTPDFDKAMLLRCFARQPSWASSREAGTVIKYKGINDYRARDTWNAEYRLVPATYAEAEFLYREGQYAVKAPPVSHSAWTEADWIKYIWDIDQPKR